MNQLQAQEYQTQQQQRQHIQQQSQDPWQNFFEKFDQHNSVLNNQNNNNRIKIREITENQYGQQQGGQDSQMKQGQKINNLFITPQTQTTQPSFQKDQSLSTLTAYQKVFKTTPDGKVVCNFEDVKKYMESETHTEITPKLSTGIKRIVEIDHKM